MTHAEAVAAIRAHAEAHYPRTCSACGRTFDSLKTFLSITKRVGDFISHDAERGDFAPVDPLGAVAMFNCPCGTTLSITSHGMKLGMLWSLLWFARADTQRRGITYRQWLLEIQHGVAAQVFPEGEGRARAQAHGDEVPASEATRSVYGDTLRRLSGTVRAGWLLGWAMFSALGLVNVARGLPVTPLFVVTWSLFGVAVALVIALKARPHAVAAVSVAGLFAVELAALALFGPGPGHGALLAMTVLVVSVFWGRTPGLVTGLVGGALFPATGLVLRQVDGFAGPPLDVWVRVGAVTGGVLVMLTLAVNTMRRSLRHSIDALEKSLKANERTQAQLARSRELETAGRLVSGVVHDVNNTYTVVLNSAEELLIEPDEAARRQLAEDIIRATKASTMATAKLLGLVRTNKSEPAWCDPANELRAIANTLRRLLPHDVRFETSFDSGGQVAVQGSVLTHAVLNLVLNARDSLEGERKVIELRVELQGADVVVTVSDTGRGMDAETRARLWEPFFTTKGTSGTGLGMSSVQACADAAGGSVSVESTLGEGSTFRLRLPLRPASARAADEVDLPPTTSLRGKTILVVEDDASIRRLLELSFERAGARTLVVGSVDAAVWAIDESGQRIDALCCDGVLNDGTAARVVSAFTRRFPMGRVLICSAHTLADLHGRGIDVEVLPLLAKPFGGGEAVAAMLRLLELPRAQA